MAVSFERTKARTDFIKDNWGILSRKDMAYKLGCSAALVGMIGVELNLPLQHRSPTLPKRAFYTVESIQRTGNLFKIGKKIKLRVNCGHGKHRIVKGTVVDKTKCLVVVQEKNHRQSFKYVEFCVGEVEVI